MKALKEWRDVLSVPRKREQYSSYVDSWEQKIHSLLEFDPQRAGAPGAAEGLSGGRRIELQNSRHSQPESEYPCSWKQFQTKSGKSAGRAMHY